MAKVNLETFRCTATERGKLCVCEFTLANAFTYSIKTLVRRNPNGVTLRTIASNGLCPFHARLLATVRKDIRRMDNVLSEFRSRVKKARGEWYWERRDLEWVQRSSQCAEANMPAMARAMKVAGVGTEWPTW